MIEIQYEVTKVLYRDDMSGYSVVKAKFKKMPDVPPPTSELIIVGSFPSIMEEDEFESSGEWTIHKLYGYQFSSTISKRILPETQKGLVAFIQKFVDGVGKKMAERIVETLGSKTLEIIDSDWEKLLTVKGVGRTSAIKIRDKLKLNKIFEEVTMFILSNGGSYRMALNAFEVFNEETMVRVRENPYCLASVPKIDFLAVDKIGERLSVPYNNPIRIAEAIMHFIEQDSINKGNLFIYKDVLFEDFNEFIMMCGSIKGSLTHEEIQKGLDVLLEREAITIVVEGDKRFVYITKNYFIEEKIIELLKKHLTEFKSPIADKSKIDSFIEAYESTQNFKMAEKQKQAVHMALSNGVSILTGGPGTGKTQTINSIIQCIKAIKPEADLSLCAPTGRASKRMTELTNMDASTIHRLIGLNMFDRESESIEIYGDFVLVDEASMIDAFIFYRLLLAIDENTRILFVGDHNQLPSVGPGLILRDLIGSNKIPVTVLTEIFRQAQDSDIVTNAHKIITGIKSTDKNGLVFNRKKGNCFFMQKQGVSQIHSAVISAIKRMLVLGYKMNEIQVLLPIKGTDLGVFEFNAKLQEEFNPGTFEKTETHNVFGIIREGDRIIHTVNNYDLGVFNGEVGVVTKVYEDEENDKYVCVEFPDKDIEYDEQSIDEIMLSYAMTIHKSQGSEFKAVIMVLHNKYRMALNRNIVYTALTRAKEMAVIIGDIDMLDYAIDKEDNTQRNSRVKAKLIKEL